MSDAFENRKVARKPRLDLVPLDCLLEVAGVFEHGARKYVPWNWQAPRCAGMITAREAYLGATLRHLAEYQAGREIDEESGFSHVAHAIASLLILTYHIDQEAKHGEEDQDGAE